MDFEVAKAAVVIVRGPCGAVWGAGGSLLPGHGARRLVSGRGRWTSVGPVNAGSRPMEAPPPRRRCRRPRGRVPLRRFFARHSKVAFCWQCLHLPSSSGVERCRRRHPWPASQRGARQARPAGWPGSLGKSSEAGPAECAHAPPICILRMQSRRAVSFPAMRIDCPSRVTIAWPSVMGTLRPNRSSIAIFPSWKM